MSACVFDYLRFPQDRYELFCSHLTLCYPGSLCGLVEGICSESEANIEQVQEARQIYDRTYSSLKREERENDRNPRVPNFGGDLGLEGPRHWRRGSEKPGRTALDPCERGQPPEQIE
jgi:hypothetical protein